MALAKPVTIGAFLRHVDMSPLLDEDETVRQFIRSAGSDVAAFRSYWGDEHCWFLTIAGFDFIFVKS
jgi:acetyl esterase/lipase